MKHLGNILCFLFLHTADPPRVITHLISLKDAVPGQPVTFTVEAVGTEPLNYQWQWKPAGDEQGEWLLCDLESSDGTTLKIPNIQKLNEGSYQCVISNCAGSQISKPAKLSVGKSRYRNCMKNLGSILCFLFQHTADPPRVITHPQGVKDAVPGQPVTFTVHATGTEPLNYKWQWKPAGEEGGIEEWPLCDMESSDGTTLTIPSVQKLNEGSYQCVISNCAGSQTSTAAKLCVGKNSDIKRNCMKHLSSILPSISAYSCSSTSYRSSKMVKGCCSRTTCYIHCPCHWYRATQLPVAVDTCWVWG